MAVLLEKFVRPAQQQNFRPVVGRQSTEQSSPQDAVVRLKIDLGGNAAEGSVSGPKILQGSFSSSTSFYVEAYVNEQWQL